MIDDSDGDFALMLSATGGPIGGILCLVLAIVLYYVACHNEKECNAKTCPTGEVAHVLDHECVCTSKPGN